MFVIKSLYAAFFEITGSASRPTGPRAVKPAKTSLPPQAAVRPTAWGAAQKAIGLSLSAVQHLASLTRKSRPSVESNYQAGFCSQGIKNHRTCR